MEKRTLTIIIFAILIIGFVWFVFSPRPEKNDGSKQGTAIGTGWTTYTNDKLGFDIELPPGFTADESYVNTMLGPGHDIPGVAFKLPPTFTNGTNLSDDTHLAIEKLSGVPCEPGDFLPENKTGVSATIGKNQFLYATSTGAGAGNLYNESVYTILKGGSCYAIHYFVHSGNIMNYEPGTVKQFDEKGLYATFNSMASTFNIH